MKKAILSILAMTLVLALLLSGCATPGAPASSQEPSASSEREELTGNVYSFDHLQMVLPDGFTAQEDEAVILVTGPEYPAKTDNITFTKSGKDSIAIYTQEFLESYYKENFPQFIQSVSYDKLKVDGVDSIKYAYDLSQTGIDMRQTQYMIFGDTFSDIVSFTSVTGEYDEAFEACANSFRVVD